MITMIIIINNQIYGNNEIMDINIIKSMNININNSDFIYLSKIIKILNLY